ncbi:uncharacterized protein LOC124704706 [Lolium rigidum]|uniref:uncharacterized protein LOC124704706 n=1 Tax=Lolium rigidum TaxID=89674 RepID=UPI001F5D7F08|nr:uncharacterized protein LOC124704706 [Lolium rigidum]XP_051205597.1 uncharacterized protein LOC127319669 [Lolium perenne]
MDPRRDAAQRATPHVPATSSSTAPPPHVPEYHVPPTAKPVLNYSIQTGEEFALEFMRDRALSHKNLLPGTSGGAADQNAATGYMDLRAMLAASHTGSEAAPGIFMMTPLENPRQKESDRKPVAQIQNRSTHTSTRSAPRALSGDGSGRGYASSEASDTARRIKFLCSFGGKILPRPSDGKLRYAGGETRIVRISKDISWEELKHKTTGIFNQPHVIKYQLPGEDLDALISVSGDDDLRNMMDEFDMIESEVGASQKLRVFLFSSLDFDDMNLGSMDADSEIQYVVAVNGIDVGSGKPSSGHGLASTSGSMLAQFINLNADDEPSNPNQDRSDFHGQSLMPSVTMPTPTLPSLSSDYTANMQSYQGSEMQYTQGSSNNFYGTERHISLPLSVPSDYGGTLQYAPYSGIASLATSDQRSYQDGFMSQGSGNDAKQVSKNSLHQKNEVDYFQTLENLSAPAPHNDLSASNSMQLEVPPASSAQEGRPSFLQPSDSGKSLEIPMASRATSAAHGSEFNEDDRQSSGGAFASGCSDFGSDMTDHSFKNSQPGAGRTFQSERIPREHAESLNRLSKSDDSGSQFLKLQSQSITEAADSVEGAEKTNSGAPSLNLNDPPSDDSLVQFEKNFSKAVPQPSQFGIIIPSEESDAKMTSANPVVEQQQVSEKTPAKGNLKASTTNRKQPGSDAAMARRVSWEAPRAVLPNDGKHDPAVPSPTSTTRAVPDGESAAANTENRDIFVDINDRFPPDVLSDFFAKAKDAQSSTPFTDPILSLNMPNYEPKNWSFFRNLAKDEFPSRNNDQGLAKIDEGVYTLAGASNDSINMKGLNPNSDFEAEKKPEPVITVADISSMVPAYTPSYIDHRPVMERSAEVFQVDNPYAPMGDDTSPPVPEFEDPKFEEDRTVGQVMDATLRDSDFEHLQIIKNEDLEELRELGSGTFGTVYHGKWRGTDVAIKRIKKSCFTGRSSEQERLAQEFWREAEILSRLHHPNVVAFYGVVKDGPGGTLATLTEFMVNGSLRHVLQRKDKCPDLRKRLIIAMDAAFGMEYLHSKNIVHFDLKCDNLLVNLRDHSRPICKVGDFGLSKIKRNTLVSGGVRGTLPWMAPELLNGSSSKVSEKVDVFSFGIVMWEILTGEEPYANMHYGAIIGGIVNNTLRPPVPANCDPEWRRLMEQCWSPDPGQRPAFTEIAGRLRSMSAVANQAAKAAAAAAK